MQQLHIVHSSSTSRTTSYENLAIVDPNLPRSAAASSGTSSLKHEIESASEGRAGLVHSRPTSSLASHVTGATFASIARAAELQAARARQGLNVLDVNALGRSGPTHSNVPESMGARKRRGWKKLDLSELSDVESVPFRKENQSPQTGSPSLADNGDGGDGLRCDIEPDAHVSTPADSASPQEPGILAPRPGNLLRNHLGEDISASPSPSVLYHSSPAPDSEGVGSTAEMASFTDPKFSSLNMSSAPFYPRSGYAYDTTLEYGDEEDPEAQADATTMKSSLPLPAQLPPATYPRVDNFVSNPTEFRAAAEEALRSTYPFVGRSTGGGIFNTATTQGITQLKAKPPHFYPAVKGTRSDLERGSAASFRDVSNSFPADLTAMARGQSEDAADHAISAAEWNVRTDLEPPRRFAILSKRASTLTEEEDYEMWKNRRVPIVNAAAKNARTDDPIVFGMRMTADGVFPVHDNLKTTSAPPPSPQVPTRRRANQGWYDLLTDTYRTDGRGEPKEEQQFKTYSSLFARNKPAAQPTAAERSLEATKMNAEAELTRLRAREAREAGERAALRAANFPDDPPPNDEPPLAELGAVDANDVSVSLLLPALANLATYKRGSRFFVQDYFHRMGEAPSWCVDHGPEGNNSFFGGDWGTPPARVGRDPRYRLNGRNGPADWNIAGERAGGRAREGRRPPRWLR